jgi:hypothetical protein
MEKKEMKTPGLNKAPRRFAAQPPNSRRFLDDLIRANAPAFGAFYVEEPKLVFGSGELSVDPKSGLENHGPFGWEATPSKTIRLGVVGTSDGIQTFTSFLQRSQRRIPAGFNTRGKPLDPLCFPDFPGCECSHTFRSTFVCDNPSHLRAIHGELLERAAAEHDEQKRVEAVVRIFVEQIAALEDLDPAPDVVVVVMPPSVEATCATIGAVFARQRLKLSPHERFQRTLQQDMAVSGQGILSLNFDAAEEDHSPNLRAFFNIHHALKAHAMGTGLTTQLVWESTLNDPNPASVAWNLLTALYYKAGNNPWRLQSLPDNTCYVGVSFFKESPRAGADMHTSLAQVFGAGEGIVLRGEKAILNKDRDRKPHLSEAGAESLLTRALQSYARQHNSPPKRVVMHKTSRYWPEELRGLRKGLGSVYHYDFLALESREIRFMRVGHKPPIRGTVIVLGRHNYLLYCNGYVPYLRCFPGKRIPRPLEIVEHHGDSPPTTVCQEVLALTKLNWNNCAFGSGVPITIRFARDVGKILTEVPSHIQPQTKYKFYM